MKVRKIWRSSPEYPSLLAEIPDPPKHLFASGRELGAATCMAIVGTRRASQYGLEVARWLGAELASAGLIVVSGLAHGIDAAAHQGALDVDGSTVAVLGCGVDICYPARNRDLYRRIAERGTIVSELECGVRPLPHHFPIRNRIIAGMSLGVVIVEARPKGGAMITARLANEFGREVFAIPGLVNAQTALGPHQLMRDGARLVTSARDILEDLGLVDLDESGQPELILQPDEALVIRHLGPEPVVLDRIAKMAAIPASTAAAVLSKLELRGLVARHPGGRFALTVGTVG